MFSNFLMPTLIVPYTSRRSLQLHIHKVTVAFSQEHRHNFHRMFWPPNVTPFVAFMSFASWQPSSQGTVGSNKIMFLSSGAHSTTSGCREVWTTSGNCCFRPTSTFTSQGFDLWNVPGLVPFFTKYVGLITSETLSRQHLYLPWVRAGFAPCQYVC